jgi:hypothetical protein
MFFEVELSQMASAGTLTGSELLYMEQNGSPVKVTPDQLGAIAPAIPASRTGTKVQLNALVTGSLLKQGQFYKCTDATTNDVELILLAVAVNKFSVWAYSTSFEFENDEINYNFTTDAIIWRKDTVNNISVFQDLRNLSGLTIGTGCTNITLGPGVTGSIANNCRNIVADRDCVLNIGATSLYINCGVETTLTTGTDAYDLQIGGNCTVVLGNFCSKWRVGSGSSCTGSGVGKNNVTVGSDVTLICGSAFSDSIIGSSSIVTTSGDCNKIIVGSGSEVSIGVDSTNITIGSNCVFNCLESGINISIADSSTVTLGDNCSRISIGFACSITAGSNLANKVFGNSISDDFTSATTLYSINSGVVVLSESGEPRFLYLDATNTSVNVLATT